MSLDLYPKVQVLFDLMIFACFLAHNFMNQLLQAAFNLLGESNCLIWPSFTV